MASADTWAVIPVKPFAEAKRRLAAVAGDSERRDLARALFEHTLTVVRDVIAPEKVLVVSRDPAVLALAEQAGVQRLAERGRSLNSALRQATGFAVESGAGAVLVVASDLPLLAAADLVAMTGSDTDSVAIAPNRERSGTNALYLCTPIMLEFAFGRNSFARHLASAVRAGYTPTVIDRAGLAFDLDLPDDLAELRARQRDGFSLTPALSPAAG